MSIENIKEEIKKDPQNEGLYFELAIRLADANEFATSIEVLEKARVLGMPKERCIIEEARIYTKSGDIKKALDIYRGAEKSMPDNGELLAEYGRVLEREGRYLEASEKLALSIEKGFSNQDTLKDLGRAYIELKDYDTALEVLKKAVEGDADDTESFLLYSRAASESGKTEEAVELLKSFSGDDSDKTIDEELASLMIRAENYEEALKYIYSAAEKDNSSPNLYIKAALIERGLMNEDKAVSALEKGLSLTPNEDLFLKNKILNEIEITRKKVILQSKPRSLGVNLSSRCDLKCIMCMVRKHKWDMPKERIEEIVELFPYLEFIFWQGGELFLLEYFEELFEKAAIHPNLNQIVVTHGLLINERWAEKLTRSNTTLLFSIDSVNKERYEYIRRGGKFARLKESIDIINSYKDKRRNTPEGSKFETAINTVVMRSNCHELENIMKFAGENSFDHYHYLPVDSITTEENIFLSRDKESLDFLRESLEKAYRMAEKYNIRVYNWMPRIEGVTDLEERYGAKNDEPVRENNSILTENDPADTSSSPDRREFTNTLYCYWPWKHMFLGEAGFVRPHEICNQKEIGNLKDESVLSIWNSKRMQEYRKGIITGENTELCNYRCLDGAIPLEDLGFSMD